MYLNFYSIKEEWINLANVFKHKIMQRWVFIIRDRKLEFQLQQHPVFT
ncbi:341R [Invertebrate iridescent virus 6]|uniref:341R n=1 Tax=Invertebrate iridescent virus 6 TaxID=176652 RepID=Q91FI3_IIV6|nr:341R [Invertebrate iridescent virus 6]AAK82202.1 341R [Invertebrate iridescent virus 6]QMS79667.1 hypothetical protein IIV6-T1_334 [Invertebrate iridescent virus 6]